MVPDPDRVRVVLVVRLGQEREPLSRCERFVLQRIEPVRDAGDLHDADARILVTDQLLRRRVAQPKTVAGALEPDAQALASAPVSHVRKTLVRRGHVTGLSPATSRRDVADLSLRDMEFVPKV